MIKFMIGIRTSKKSGAKYHAIWLEDEEGNTRAIITIDRVKVMEIALLYGLSAKQLENGYVLGDSISEF